MAKIDSICVYCGASNNARPEFLKLAEDTGRLLAKEQIRLVYGGGNVGLMGASSRTAHAEGGDVLGVMPHFLTKWEKPNPDIRTTMVDTMHERKWLLFSNADAFIVLPGGIGTLEEVVETLSWVRLELHSKPVAFIGMRYWQPFVDMIDATIQENLTPAHFRDAFFVVDTPEQALAGLRERLEH